MRALRGIALFALQLIATPIAALLMILAIPLGARIVYGIAKAWCSLMVHAATLVGMRYQLEYEGESPIGPAVVLSKHSSAWETFFIVHHFPRLVPVIKRELLWVPFFGWGLALCRSIAIDRSLGREARAQVQAQGIDRLRQGLWVMIFPEGTRIPAGQRGRYASGGTSLAMAANVPILALAHDAGYFWGKSLLDKRGGVIRVRISAPLRAAPGETVSELNRRAEDWIEAQIESFGHPPARLSARARAAVSRDTDGAPEARLPQDLE
jgi:1-acyl-sn-glycerol-3-phosphate acyltransferase